MIKTKVIGRVFRQDEIADQIYDMWIETELAQGARPGQFVCVYTKNAAALLPRPISICEVNEEKTMLRLVYRTVGTGTNEFASGSCRHRDFSARTAREWIPGGKGSREACFPDRRWNRYSADAAAF